MDDLRERLADGRLYLLATTALCRRPLVETVRLAVAGGVDVVQLREKEADDRALLGLAREVADAARAGGALFVVNDRIKVARDAGADGVHLGQGDRSVAEARALLGDRPLVGLSTHDRDQAAAAVDLGADYLGFGPVFATATKATGYTPRGADLAGEVGRTVPRPVFAIGGIDEANLPALVAAGARRIAVSSAICGADDPEAAARALRRRLTDA